MDAQREVVKTATTPVPVLVDPVAELEFDKAFAVLRTLLTLTRSSSGIPRETTRCTRRASFDKNNLYHGVAGEIELHLHPSGIQTLIAQTEEPL